jgi:IclR family transcriptional regulator, acetate operon repressor
LQFSLPKPIIGASFSERLIPFYVFSLMKSLRTGTKAIAAGDAAADVPVSGSASARSLALLAVLAAEGRALQLSDFASRLSLPKATAHRLCTQLLEAGYLMRGLEEKEFAVGPALRRLALDTLNHGTVRGLRHEVLADLVSEVGETCNFTTLDGASVLYLDRVEAPWPWRLTLDVGVHVPLHCTASGKLFLASMSPRKRRALLGGLTLQRMTEGTLVSQEALQRECQDIARQDYALDREEFITGLVAAAVPVRAADGQVRAAIAVHAPKARMNLSDAMDRLPALRAAARRMAALL